MGDEELQAKIAKISGKINKVKGHQAPPQQYASQPPARHHARWSPYQRGGRPGYARLHKNRTLVMNGAAQATYPSAPTPETPSAVSLAESSALADAFVSTRRPGMNQLMKKDTFDREQKQKLEQKEQARTDKRSKINHEERSRLMHHVQSTSGSATREMLVEGIRFQLRDDGSKLIRVLGERTSVSCTDYNSSELSETDASNSTKDTPKKVKIADVEFFRTKNGNLVRANAVKDLNRPAHRKQKPQCEHFTKHGNCPYGPSCNFSHDPDKVAVCKDFLRQGTCAADELCDMSHDLTYHRVSACTHFLRGNCTNAACRYPHIHVSPTASVCRSFATLGFCAKGPDCEKRHVFECPDYANHGHCANHENGKCPLPHPDRAAILRKVAAKQAKIGSEGDSDLSSDEQGDDNDASFDDIDSDAAEDVIMGGDNNHELTQQQDYVAFS